MLMKSRKRKQEKGYEMLEYLRSESFFVALTSIVYRTANVPPMAGYINGYCHKIYNRQHDLA